MFFYTNARFAGQTAILAGPFKTSAEAEHCIDLLIPLFEAEDSFAPMASYGVMSTVKHAGYGIYNLPLRLNGINVEMPEISG